MKRRMPGRGRISSVPCIASWLLSGQKDTLPEYKKEGYAMFAGMMQRFSEDVAEKTFRLQIRQDQAEQVSRLEVARSRQPVIEGKAASGGAFAAAATDVSGALQSIAAMSPSNRPELVQATVKHDAPKVGRNDPCPCGSGKKYKKCHGV